VCIRILIAVSAIAISPLVLSAQVVLDSTEELRGVDVIEHLGDRVPLDLTFVNTSGDVVSLGTYFEHGVPVLLTVYYSNCPMLCSYLLTGVSKSVNQINLVPGRDFQILSISVDSLETPDIAAAAKDRFSGMLSKAASKDAWEFLVSPEGHARAIARALGFEYYRIEESGEFAHPIAGFVLTENGKISRYLYGIEYNPRDLRLALLEASEGKVRNTVDRIILYCYHYDPDSKGYVVFAGNIMRLGGTITVVILAIVLAGLWLRERRRGATRTTS